MPTLEQLERHVWPDPGPGEATNLIMKCHRLRKKDIGSFTPEDLRVLVGQSIGLKHLTPLALAILERDPLEAGGMGFPGALLTALVRKTNWAEIEGWSSRIEAVCQAVLSRLAADKADVEINGQTSPAADRATAAEINAYLNRRSHKH